MKTHVHALIAVLVAPLALAAKGRMAAQRLLNTQSGTLEKQMDLRCCHNGVARRVNCLLVDTCHRVYRERRSLFSISP